jgi:hypothetical protein
MVQVGERKMLCFNWYSRIRVLPSAQWSTYLVRFRPHGPAETLGILRHIQNYIVPRYSMAQGHTHEHLSAQGG